MRVAHPIATGRTGRRQRNVVRLVHDRRRRPLSAATIRAPWFATRPTGPPFRRTLRKRRRLPSPGSPRRLEFVFQPRVLAFQSCPVALHPGPFHALTFELLTQPRILASQLVDRLGRLLARAPAHAPVMPEFLSEYKSDAVTKYQSPRPEIAATVRAIFGAVTSCCCARSTLPSPARTTPLLRGGLSR